MPKYSIIIPFYNVEDYILDCVRSVSAQKFIDFEALFINDGSLDNSEDILKKYLKENPDKRIKILKKTNGGLSDARNYGLKKSKGKYICFIDSDDFIDTNMLEKIDSKIKDSDIDMLVFDFYEYYNESKKVLRKGINNKSLSNKKKSILLSPPAAWNKVYNRKLLLDNKILYPVGLWYEDLATTPRLALCAKKIIYINQPFYYYRQRQGSIMSTFNEKILDMTKSLDIVYSYYYDNRKLSLYKEEIEYIYIYNCYFVVRMYAENTAINKVKKQKDIIKYLNSKFDKWYKNKYFNQASIISKLNMLTMKYSKLLYLYNILRRINK